MGAWSGSFPRMRGWGSMRRGRLPLAVCGRAFRVCRPPCDETWPPMKDLVVHADPRSLHALARDRHRPSPFFLVGVDRSGTTLLRTMLNRHRNLAIPPESHFIPRLWRRRRRYGHEGRIERTERFLADLAAETRYRSWELPLDDVRRELVRMAAPTFSEAIAAIYRVYTAGQGKTRWGDKTPGYAECIPLLGRLFPQARFVHLIRDGRDVALSMLDREQVSKYRTGKEPLHRHAATPAFFWSRRIRIAHRAAKDLGVTRYLEIRYEDLLEDPEGQLRRLCLFLGEEFDPAVLTHHPTALEGVPSSQRWLHTRLSLPPTKGLRDWRRQMPAREVAEFEAIAGRQLSALDYPVVSGSRRSGLRAWSRVIWFGVSSFHQRMGRRRRHQRRRQHLRHQAEAA